MTDSPEPRIRIAVIIASTRPGRFADTVSRWLVKQIHDHLDTEIDIVDLRDLALSSTWEAKSKGTYASAGVRRLAEQIDGADAFVVVTPEYNHSFPAPLKVALDALRTEWQAKPVAFVSYGGASGGIRAVEQLRLVVAALLRRARTTAFGRRHVVGIGETTVLEREAATPDAGIECITHPLQQLDALVQHRLPRSGQTTPVFCRGTVLSRQFGEGVGDVLEPETDPLRRLDERDPPQDVAPVAPLTTGRSRRRDQSSLFVEAQRRDRRTGAGRNRTYRQFVIHPS